MKTRYFQLWQNLRSIEIVSFASLKEEILFKELQIFKMLLAQRNPVSGAAAVS